MGSNLQCRTLDLQRDWLGHENISEVLNFTRPDVIQEIHEEFLAVGCDAVETNTFTAARTIWPRRTWPIAPSRRIVSRHRLRAGRATSSRRRIGAICRRFDRPGHENPHARHDRLGRRWKTATRAGARSARRRRGCAADRNQQDMLAVKCCIVAANRAMKEASDACRIMVQASASTRTTASRR